MEQQPDERDLSFKPASDVGAKKLTKQQIDQFNELGYVFPIELFDENEIANVRDYLDHLFRLLANRGQRDNYALLGYHTRCAGLFDLVTNPKILDYAQDLVGPDIICWTSHAFCKVPYDPKPVPFHQDASYWPLTPARSVTVWIAVDDSDRENSCLQYIPRTHRMGHLKYSDIQPDIVFDRKISDVESYGEVVNVELRAGSCSLHADMTAHGSDPNASPRRRCGFAIRYSPVTVKPLIASWSWNAVLCRGTDTTGNWTHNPRPHGDDVGDWPSYWAAKFRKSGSKIKSLSGGAIGA